jgi:hypothetical protein
MADTSGPRRITGTVYDTVDDAVAAIEGCDHLGLGIALRHEYEPIEGVQGQRHVWRVDIYDDLLPQTEIEQPLA